MYKELSWNELCRIRDSLLYLADMGIINAYDGVMSETIKDINDEIDRRYNLGTTKG